MSKTVMNSSMTKSGKTQFWKLRAKHGRDKIFGDADLLRREAEAYFEWCDSHPLYRAELVKYQGAAEEVGVTLGRPYTIEGLTRYLGVSGGYFRAAKANLRDRIERGKAEVKEIELLETIESIEQVVRTQQLEGAMVGIFSPNLVARLNGIADNTNVANSGGAVLRVSVRDKETAEVLKKLEESL